MRSRVAARLLVAALSVLAAGCENGSPTEGSRSAGNVIVFADGGALAALEPTIRGLLETTLQTASGALPITDVTITVTPDPGRAIAGWGIGGFTPNGHLVDLVIDPSYPGLAQVLPTRLPPLAAHELHHAMRWRGPGYGMTLLEAMVSEGLADHFAVELLGSAIPPWSDAFSRDRTEHYLDLARPELDSAAFDFGAWFFGESPAFPRWTGYTLGYRLVEAYQARNPGRSAAQLVNTPAEAFRPGG